MFLPQPALFCIDRLEQAGFPTYAVGGCVRDSLLGRTPGDYDLCTAATPAQIAALFGDFPLVRSGEKHGTVGVVVEHTVYEITTFRLEGGYRDNRHPDWVQFVSSIEEDLSRRDFTVNAMAYSPTRGLADPFGGRQDLERGILRAVGDPRQRFSEDALRILRGVRFSVRYGLTPEAATEAAMVESAPLMDGLARERVFDELCKLLPLVKAEDLLRYAPILARVIPELAPCIGFEQHCPYHKYDVYTHSAYVTAAVEPTLPLRWAALLHDVGKPGVFTRDETGRGHFYGHATLSAQLADNILLRLKAPTALRQNVVTLIAQHMTDLQPDKKLLKKRMSKLGPDTVAQLLALQEADFGGKGRSEDSRFPQIRALLQEILEENACLTLKDLALNGHDLLELGLSGPAIGQALEGLLSLVLDERIPNEKEALLGALKKEICV